MRVLGISGSLRRGSHSSALLRAAEELTGATVASRAGTGRGAEDPGTFEYLDGLANLPAFDGDLESDPGFAVDRLRERIASADALVIVTPEYNGSIPGFLKNALDWASRPHGDGALVGKPVAVIGNSPSPFGAAWAQEHLRRSLALSGSIVLETELTVGNVAEKLKEAGEPTARLTDGDTRKAIEALLVELTATYEATRSEAPVAA